MSAPTRDAITEAPTSDIRLIEGGATAQSSVELVVSDIPNVSTATALIWTDRLLACSTDVVLREGRLNAIQCALVRVADLFEPCSIAVLLEYPHPAMLVPPSGPAVVLEDTSERVLAGTSDELRFSIQGELGAELILVLPQEPTLDTAASRWLAIRLVRVLSSLLAQVRTIERSGGQIERVAKLEAQVMQAEKLASLGEIAAGIVHELNNPLTSIVAYSEALLKRSEADGASERDAEPLRRISEGADRILRFSRDLVAYARPSSGVRSPVNIHDVIDQALVFCEHVLSKHGVEVERRFDAPAGPVLGVSGELTQVFVNLVTNACHAFGEGATSGVVVIASESDGHDVLVSVHDDGSGIDAGHIERVFDPFFTTKPAGKGTGLGLSIVRGIVERHGGVVSVESDPDAGTTFWVRFPLMRA